MKHSYTEQEFRQAVKESRSIRQTLQKLGVKPAGGNYRVFRKFAKKYNVDTSHFTGQAHNRGKRYINTPTEKYLSNEVSVQSYRLKNRLLKEGILKHVCSRCNNTVWNKQPIPLELDHIDGNHQNNQLPNLRLLCPNCHAQTSNYRGKNKRKH